MLCPVLVVDDDALVRDSICDALQSEGHAVQRAADGLQALAILRASPRALVVLLDFQMPHLDGGGVLAIVAQDAILASRDAYILCTAVTRTLPLLVVKLSADLGVVVLAKPFELQVLFDTVDAACRRLALGA